MAKRSQPLTHDCFLGTFIAAFVAVLIVTTALCFVAGIKPGGTATGSLLARSGEDGPRVWQPTEAEPGLRSISAVSSVGSEEKEAEGALCSPNPTALRAPEIPPDGACPPLPRDSVTWALRHQRSGPFQFPKVIHQSVKDKSRLSCQHLESINTWRKLNPGYTHMLWDDKDQRRFMQDEFPNFLAFYNSLATNIERMDLWKYLVLYQYGGVYADSDVSCLKPIDRWNDEYQHDAEVLVGTDFREKTPAGFKVVRWNSWVIAATRCHPLLGNAPYALLTAAERIDRDALTRGVADMGGRAPRVKVGEFRDARVSNRTGIYAWTDAVHNYLALMGVTAPVVYDSVDSTLGLRVGTVRLMPIKQMSQGWDTMVEGKSCSDLAAESKVAYACHRFFGSWRDEWSRRPTYTYEGCPGLMPLQPAAPQGGAAA